ncbi:MAG TPA: tetratricopeptide repeat protein [Vicinamibacterales bacterium]|nr:tetratricopeptide repeat protein [Vicinamibacterales bacterium]
MQAGGDLESTDPGLTAALKAEASRPAADTYKAVADEYLRLGVYDRAIAFLTRAIDLSPRDSILLAARARARRDFGQPDAALGDAHRAVSFAPTSPDAHNTLGTVQFALGQPVEAVASFERALTLAPDATWALNNLCYVALIDGDEQKALARCRAALERDPGSSIARNNLALVQAAAGRLDDARDTLMASGNRAAAQYNFGILLLSRKDYGPAAAALTEACRLAPAFEAACTRAFEARTLAAGARRIPR